MDVYNDECLLCTLWIHCILRLDDAYIGVAFDESQGITFSIIPFPSNYMHEIIGSGKILSSQDLYFNLLSLTIQMQAHC